MEPTQENEREDGDYFEMERQTSCLRIISQGWYPPIHQVKQ